MLESVSQNCFVLGHLCQLLFRETDIADDGDITKTGWNRSSGRELFQFTLRMLKILDGLFRDAHSDNDGTGQINSPFTTQKMFDAIARNYVLQEKKEVSDTSSYLVPVTIPSDQFKHIGLFTKFKYEQNIDREVHQATQAISAVRIFEGIDPDERGQTDNMWTLCFQTSSTQDAFKVVYNLSNLIVGKMFIAACDGQGISREVCHSSVLQNIFCQSLAGVCEVRYLFRDFDQLKNNFKNLMRNVIKKRQDGRAKYIFDKIMAYDLSPPPHIEQQIDDGLASGNWIQKMAVLERGMTRNCIALVKETRNAYDQHRIAKCVAQDTGTEAVTFKNWFQSFKDGE